MSIILGIESSCDETSAAVVCDNHDLEKRILSNIVLSQMDMHKVYGGVVPEIAARAHLDHIQSVVKEAIDTSQMNWDDIDAFAATTGPGLIGGVLVGAQFAKALSISLKKPFIGINHLEGHALTPRLTHNIPYPYLLLLMSGGHCQFVEVLGLGNYRVLGSTLDDAVGECFDKVAKMLNLPYPGGPEVEKHALKGVASFDFPTPLLGREGCDFSFSGLKTAVRRLIENHPKEDSFINDVCASFQLAVSKVIQNRLSHALEMCSHAVTHVVVAGGVAANKMLSSELKSLLIEKGIKFCAPPSHLCTDNAAMIAWAGVERYNQNLLNDISMKCRPRWPIDKP